MIEQKPSSELSCTVVRCPHVSPHCLLWVLVLDCSLVAPPPGTRPRRLTVQAKGSEPRKAAQTVRTVKAPGRLGAMRRGTKPRGMLFIAGALSKLLVLSGI